MRAYLEPSAIDALVRCGVDAHQFGQMLRDRGLVPVVSHFTIHELARTLTVSRTDEGRSLLTFVRDLSPQYHLPPSELWKREVDFLRTGEPVDPLLDDENSQLTDVEVRGMALGQIGPELKQLIEHRIRDKHSFRPSTEAYLGEVRKLRREDPRAVPRISTFSDVLAHFAPDIPRFLRSFADGSLRDEELLSIASRPAAFPAHAANLRYWFYMIFICLRHKAVPGLDKLDDYRHLVEAAYCEFFITGDAQQVHAAASITPSTRVLPVANLLPAF